jgi:hypothetical protein
MKHAKYSPSKLEALEQCVRFEYEEIKDGSDEEGTLLHTATATGKLEGLTDEQRRAVSYALLETQAIRDEDSVCQEATEVKVELKELTWGYADRIIYHPKMTHVIEYKFGRKEVSEAKDNFQGQCYCAAVLEERTELTDDEIKLHIIAPRAKSSSYVFGPDLLSTIRKRIAILYDKINNPFTLPTANEELCAKCANAYRCPEVHKAAVAYAVGLGLPTPSAYKAEALVSVRDRYVIHVVGKAIKNLDEQWSKANLEFVKAGNVIPGLKLVTRNSGATVPKANTTAALKRLLSEEFIETIDSGLGACSLSVKVLAEQLQEVKGETVEYWKLKIIGALGDLVETGSCQYLQAEKIKAKKES